MRRFFAKLLLLATLLAFGVSQSQAELIDLPIETTDKKVELRLYPSIWTSLWEYFFGDDQVEIAFHVYGPPVRSTGNRKTMVHSKKAVSFLVPKTATLDGISKGPGDLHRASFRMYYKDGLLHVGLFSDSGFDDIDSFDRIGVRLRSIGEKSLAGLRANLLRDYFGGILGLPDGSFQCSPRHTRCAYAIREKASLLPRHNGFLLLEGIFGRPDPEIRRRSLDYPFNIASVFILPAAEAEEPFFIACRRYAGRKRCSYYGLLADMFPFDFTIEDLDIEDIRQKREAIYRWLETHALTP